jgi:hypothetical protein
MGTHQINYELEYILDNQITIDSEVVLEEIKRLLKKRSNQYPNKLKTVEQFKKKLLQKYDPILKAFYLLEKEVEQELELELKVPRHEREHRYTMSSILQILMDKGIEKTQKTIENHCKPNKKGEIKLLADKIGNSPTASYESDVIFYLKDSHELELEAENIRSYAYRQILR